MIYREKIGIMAFDEQVGGLPTGGLSIAETPDHRTGLVLLGHYLKEGLENGEKCCFISFESPVTFVDYFEKSFCDFHKYLEQGELIFLNFNNSMSTEIGLRQNYDQVFEEITHLCGKNVNRIAINQIDALFSLHNTTIINTCAQKISIVVDGIPQSVLGQFIQFNDKVHQSLRISFQKVAHSYFSILESGKNNEDLLIKPNKVPWYDYKNEPILLNLEKGLGFATRSKKTG